MCRITLIIGYIAIAGLVATTGSCAGNRSLADRIGMNDCPKGPDGQNDEVVLSETPLAKYKKLNTEDERVWIEPLMSMDLSSFSSEDDSLNVFFKIGTEINGYKVSCRFLPYGRCAETGHAVLSFVKGDLNLVLHVRKMMFYHTLLMTMAGHEWKNMDSYELNYVEPADVDMNPFDDSHLAIITLSNSLTLTSTERRNWYRMIIIWAGRAMAMPYTKSAGINSSLIAPSLSTNLMIRQSLIQ